MCCRHHCAAARFGHRVRPDEFRGCFHQTGASARDRASEHAPQRNKGRLNYTNVTLGDLAAEAFRVQRTQISGPDFLDAARFDVMAKIPEGASRERIPEMLRSLLADRFGLKVHEETKELPIYELVAAKSGPKMAKAESAGGVSMNTRKTVKHLSARWTLTSLADYLWTNWIDPWWIKRDWTARMRWKWTGERIQPIQRIPLSSQRCRNNSG